MHKPLKIFAGTNGQALTKAICEKLLIEPGKIYQHMFPSGENYCQYQENIRGCDVFLVQSICNPAHEKLMELLVMIDAAKRASAERITVVAPYLGYLRQDRKTKSRTPITARLVADLLIAAGADRIVGMDFHCEQAQGFFNIPVDHLYAVPVFAEFVKTNQQRRYAARIPVNKTVVVSPDTGGIKRASAFAKILNMDFAFISKKRVSDSEVESEGLVGDIDGCDVIILDDMTESCGTLLNATEVCHQAGAQGIAAMVTHGLLNEKAHERLRNQPDYFQLVVTDTVEQPLYCKHIVLSVANLFATAIEHINTDKSVTDLFEIKGF